MQLLVLLVLVAVRHLGDVRRWSMTYAATAARAHHGFKNATSATNAAMPTPMAGIAAGLEMAT
nr:hypothetical protein OG491_36410 [Streptomyces sp. NBC_01175]